MKIGARVWSMLTGSTETSSAPDEKAIELPGASDPLACVKCGAPGSKRIECGFGRVRPIVCGQCGASCGERRL